MSPTLFQRIAASLIAACVLVAAQEPVKPKLSPRIVTATKQVTIFTGLEAQLLQAVQKKDKATLQALVADDFTIEIPDADPLSGDEWFDSVTANDYALKSFVVRQMSVADLGDAAVVKFERLQEATSKGQADSGEFFVVDLWKRNGDSWKLTNRYVAKVSSQPVIPKAPIRPTGKQ
ncbi:MAG: hypothetical protein JWN42_1966 [Candidatus Angelobacter sp.]|nr:hypothetical protein [Candidatus Angelobacter sp.]